MKTVSKFLALTIAGAALLLPADVSADTTVIWNQPPRQNGGIGRWSKLWVDPSGQGNDLDGDAICYADFVTSTPVQITHAEWWGQLPPNRGFQLEVWKQDPGTVAYQPYGVFRDYGAEPEWQTVVTSFQAAIDGSGVWHYSVDFAQPISLAANNTANPRWFFCVIGLTTVPYLEWSWYQNRIGTGQTFQWIRGDGNRFYHLGDGRAMILKGKRPPRLVNPGRQVQPGG